MRLSRNRNWGHPELIHFLKGLGTKVAKAGTWRGLLVGDMSQPRGGPMITGHASHQVGLDADIWLTPMPPQKLTRVEREEMSATMVVADDRRDVDPKVWTPGHFAVIKAAASDPLVQRINAPPDRFHYCVRCLPGGSLSALPVRLCREDALGSLVEVSENALMGHQDWIAGLAAATAAGDVSGLVLGVPLCNLKGRIA
jgi:hypothetical protein